MARKKNKTPIQKLDAWHNTKPGYVLFAVAELLLAYGFISWAIDVGELWMYLVGIILIIGALRNIVKLVVSFFKK